MGDFRVNQVHTYANPGPSDLFCGKKFDKFAQKYAFPPNNPVAPHINLVDRLKGQIAPSGIIRD